MGLITPAGKAVLGQGQQARTDALDTVVPSIGLQFVAGNWNNSHLRRWRGAACRTRAIDPFRLLQPRNAPGPFFRSTAPSLPLGLNPRAFRLPCMVTTEMEYEWVSINVRYSVFGVVFLDLETTYFANRTNAAVASFYVGISHHRQPALP